MQSLHQKMQGCYMSSKKYVILGYLHTYKTTKYQQKINYFSVIQRPQINDTNSSYNPLLHSVDSVFTEFCISVQSLSEGNKSTSSGVF